MNEEINEQEKKEIIDVLKLICSRPLSTQHLELSAWAAAIFYVGGLIALSKYILEGKPLYNLPVFIVILLLCFVVLVYIHSQYTAHISSRWEQSICIRAIFQLINDDIKLTRQNCKVQCKDLITGFSPQYPTFIQSEIKENVKGKHKLRDIGFWVIYYWAYKKIFTKNYQCDRIHLIESSLYNLVLIPTISILCLLLFHV